MPLIPPNEKGFQDEADEMYMLLNLIRFMHFFLIVSQFLSVCLDDNKNDLFTKILRTLEIFLYQGVLLYEQYHVATHKMNDPNYPLFIATFKQWMVMEVFFYYMQIFNASVFLFMIQIRGSLGKKENDSNELRYKHDAIEYYELDIDWFSFQFVLFFTHFNAFLGRSFVLKHSIDTEQQILIVMMLQRSAQFCMVAKLRDQKKKIQEFSDAHWMILFCIQFLAFVLFF